MAKRDGGGPVRGMNKDGKVVKLPPLKPAPKPTEAIVAPGQKPKDLGKSTKDNRFASNAKTPVKEAGKGFAGSGSPLGTSIKLSQPTKAGNVANALLAVTALPASGQIRAAVAKKVGTKVGQITGRVATAAEESAYRAASKGLSASGAGGKVSRTMTPMGPNLRSTAIGSAKQQAARMANLGANAARITTAVGVSADRAVALARQSAVRSTLKGFSKAAEVGRGSATIYVGAKTSPKKKKNNSK